MRVRYSFSSRHTRTLDTHNEHRSEFPAVVNEIVDKCDIILEVLDARFIEETRNLELENLIKQKGKKIIYVLNKIDLADKKKVREKIDILNLKPHIFVSCKEREGSSELRNRIKMEAKKSNKVSKIHIGVIGYPNTGKSSIINILVGRAVARTASEAGFTKGIQKINLASNLVIIDTPGVIPESRYSMQDSKKMAGHAKLSARGWDKIKEPEMVVHELVMEYPGIIEKYYGLGIGGDSELLIEELGRKKRFLLPGGKVDIDKTARLILKEWQTGKIKTD